MENLYFIINPQAKNGRCQKVWRKLEKILDEQNISYEAFFTAYPGHGEEIVQFISRKEAGKDVVIVVVGGDGTMHEAVNGAAVNSNIHLAYIPGGSGNDFSRGYGIPRNPVAALNYLLTQLKEESLLIDLGLINKKDEKDIYFVNNMGVGLDAHIARKVNLSKIKKLLNRISLGKLVYVYFLLKSVFTYQRSSIEIIVDGKRYSFHSTWFVTVSNQPFYGGGMKISPKASPFDGQLNITVVHNLSRLKLLFVFITVFWGGHVTFKEVETFTGSEIKITSPDPIQAHADGEDIGCTPLATITCKRFLPILSKASGQE
ncbi:diacylglycerol/lipid kinase family protein [Cytobacillus massiliigabonensis]|uniref:diacylglycerol/lipid kinase family protein n=1 Tax=Cytobacillus massiliigabonensis TaxID=1871011 RepID=UPI000C834F94|nr:diacylglycerol kinase family protein [Cytobacillus massiliigabonensis]